MASYLDTSFLLKLYIKEAESVAAAEWVRSDSDLMIVSPLSDIEVMTALGRSQVPAIASRNIDAYRNDVASGVFQKRSMDVSVFALAETIAESHSHRYFLRSLDVLHLAAALYHRATVLVTYDDRLARAAASAGLEVFAPRS